jgi:hypothetical protein
MAIGLNTTLISQLFLDETLFGHGVARKSPGTSLGFRADIVTDKFTDASSLFVSIRDWEVAVPMS